MITFIVILLAAAAPAGLGWWLFRSSELPVRWVAGLLGGQVLICPVYGYIMFHETTLIDDDAVFAWIIVCGLGVIVSIIVAGGLEALRRGGIE